MYDVLDLAKWFIKNDLDQPRNSIDGNMKIQKLLYFSQLIHLAKFDKVLFDSPILAYTNGSVVESVRLTYRDNHQKLISESKEFKERFNEEAQYTLSVVKDVFGDVSAKELSDLNHLHTGWHEALKRSEIGHNYYNKYLSAISLDTVQKHDLESVRKVLEAHDATRNLTKPYEVINGITFYYDPEQLTFTDDLIESLESFQGEDTAYTIYIDENAELVIS
jgi:uncharacterized phage-associated protein